MTNEPKVTKKALKAASVEAAKRAAYIRKVRNLIGFVGERLNDADAIAAYVAEKDATLFAAEIVSREPIGACVWPLKVQAIEAARKHCEKDVAENLKRLEAVEWDANKIAPYPKHVNKYARTTTHQEIVAYETAKDLHATFHSFVSPVSDSDQRQKYEIEDAKRLPCIVARDEKKIAKYIRDTEEATANLYNLFVLKLVKKIGQDAASAEIHGSHVWGYSILTVTMKDNTVQRWKTQQITNCSVLGNYFPQWPTRRLKD